MIKYKNLYLIGTSHISKNSVKEVEDKITKLKPKIVALELDRSRFNLLNSKVKRKFRLSGIKSLGFKAFLLNLIGAWFERRLGRKVGIEPGSEMKKAIELSRKFKFEICLIDQDIKQTLNKLLSRISRKEKLNLLKDLLLGDNKYSFNISEVPSENEITKIISKLKSKYPSFYLTIIKERNELMAKNLYKLMNLYPKNKIIGVVGAGHEKAIIGEIKLTEKIL